MSWRDIVKEDEPKTFRGTEEQGLTITEEQKQFLVDRIVEAIDEEIKILSDTKQVTMEDAKEIHERVQRRIIAEFRESENT